MEILKRYDEIEREILALRTEQEEIKEALKRHVADHGEVAGYGWKAVMKPGRKTINHFKALRDHVDELEEGLLEKHTTHKTVTAWAKATKEAGLELGEYTTFGESTFSIKAVG